MLIKRNKNTNIICMVIKICHKVINNNAKAPYFRGFWKRKLFMACRSGRGRGGGAVRSYRIC